jgi:hypothetical protein
MNWQNVWDTFVGRNEADKGLKVYNQFCVNAKVDADHCSFEEQEVGGKCYLVGTTPTQRKLFWEERIERWVTPRQVDPAGALQKRLALEKKLGILAVLPLAGTVMVPSTLATQGDLYQLLMNMSPLTVTRAKQLLSTELDTRGKPDFEWVALVTAEYLTTDEIRAWEAACEEIVQEDEDRAA